MPRRLPRRRLVLTPSRPTRESRPTRRTLARTATAIITFALCIPASILTPLTTCAQEQPRIIIEEIAWAGSSASIADEWIELANPGDAAIAIGGYTLHDVMAPDRTITIPDGAEIPPFGTYLIANYAETSEKSALATTVQFVTTSVSLSNSALGLELRDASGLAIDRAGDGSAPFAGSAGSFASMIRQSATSTGDQAGGWTTTATSSNWKTGVLDQGTPGVCDLCVALNAIPALDATVSEPNHGGEAPSPASSDTTTIETPTASTTQSVSESTSTTAEIVSSGATTTTSDIIASNETAQASSTTEIVTETQTETMSAETSAVSRSFVAMSEVVSNPTSGKEWIELRFESGATHTDRELFLYDGKGRIATIAANTPLTIAPHLVVSLSSAKLNNDGETLSLREASGAIIETTVIPKLEKGESWARSPQTDAWKVTETITPAADNAISTSPSQTTPAASTASTEITPATSSSTSTTTASSITTSTALHATIVTRIAVRLSEAVSNPLSGPEWIELVFADGATSTDRELLLKDAQGTIARIPAHTALTASPYLIVPLSSARLNNSGDALTLAETSGIVLDATEIPALAKGESWALHPSAQTWHIASAITPGAQNQFDEDAIADADDQPSADTDPSSDLMSAIMSAAEQSNAENSQTPSSSNVKTSSKKSDTLTTHPFSDMFDSSLNGSRVRVSGTVGSVHRLFGASHVFVLLAEDGRGLMVYLPKHLNVPTFGSTVQVNGTLSATYQGPELRMKTTDVWMTMATSTPPMPRTADLLAPGSEDAWSLTTVEGTIKAVSASSLAIETADGIEVTVSIPSAANIRAKRFQKDDTIRVTALLNIRKETPTVVVRSPGDITLISHAEGTVTLPSAGAKKGLPDWIPFIAAGGAIVATGTSKRLREYVKRKRLARKAKA